MSAIVEPRRDGSVVAERPTPGTPRPYEFPPVHQVRLENGVRVVIADLPGRPLISSAIILPIGAAYWVALTEQYLR